MSAEGVEGVVAGDPSADGVTEVKGGEVTDGDDSEAGEGLTVTTFR